MPIPMRRAVIAGLDLDADFASLERLFVAGLCGLAYGLADVIDALRAKESHAAMMVISGGAEPQPLVRQIIADTTGLPWRCPNAEPVLLGAAMLGAVAGGRMPRSPTRCGTMSAIGEVTRPGSVQLAASSTRRSGARMG